MKVKLLMTAVVLLQLLTSCKENGKDYPKYSSLGWSIYSLSDSTLLCVPTEKVENAKPYIIKINTNQ